MGALGLDLWGFIVQLIAFIIFVWLFWKFALGPITQILDQRQERVRDSLEAAERMKQELAATAQRNEQVLAEARQQAQQIVSQAREAGEAALAKAREEAGRQSDEYLARAEATLRQETESARQQLRQEVADLSVLAASRIVRKELDPATQARLIADTLAEASVS
ncbi:MAG: F0F1 ATP synthase subunit B, partial [Thermomicrobiales bacterium]|nr:F0F1 ATP synthase subunit B [Thermomicrobiales bacterium]